MRRKLKCFFGSRSPKLEKDPLFVLKEYNFEMNVHIPPPETEGWERAWHGYYHMTKTTNGKARERFNKLFKQKYYENFILEIFAMMSIIEEIGASHLNFIELGSGRAPWCMTIAGAIKFNLVPNPPSSYRLVAVEAEPDHFKWSKEHLLKQDINAEVVYGAITAKVGTCKFKADTDPVLHMGQAVAANGNIEVPSYTIDYLWDELGFEHINIIHMDIQGMEVEAIKGASESLKKGVIDYMIIGTHSRALEDELKALLIETHDLVVELPMHGTLRIPGIRKLFRSIDDGVHVYRRKNIRK